MTSPGPAEILFALCFLLVPAWGVIDAARIPPAAWLGAGRSKRFWIALQVVTLYIGTVIYLAAVRRDVLFFTRPPDPDWSPH